MKKLIFLMLVLALCICGLTGCECKHIWVEATCEVPKTCSECGLIEGSPKGHDWVDATCETPKTCIECGLVEGAVKEHNWSDATCSAPKTCVDCRKVEGDRLNHEFTKKITTSGYLSSEATVESPAVYYYACKYCEVKGTSTYEYGECKQTNWALYYYVDEFGDKTEDWYIVTRDYASGTFSNSATTDSELLAFVVYDYDGRISIFLCEYADEDNLVKNNASWSSDYYKISIRNDTGETIDVRGEMYAGSDRIFIVNYDVSKVLDMMKTSQTVKFYIQNEKYKTTTYRFDLDLTDFLYVYNIATE